MAEFSGQPGPTEGPDGLPMSGNASLPVAGGLELGPQSMQVRGAAMTRLS